MGFAQLALAYSGIAAIILSWVIIVSSILINPWFNICKGALSDLGGPRATNPSLFNFGLVAVSVLVFAFSAAMLLSSLNKVEALGSSFVAVSAMFLALIGVFHEGTYPHAFVSLWFFTQMDLAVVTWSIGLILSREFKIGITLLLMGLAAPIPAIAVKWPSTAILEVYGILIIDAATILITIIVKAREFSLSFPKSGSR